MVLSCRFYKEKYPEVNKHIQCDLQESKSPPVVGGRCSYGECPFNRGNGSLRSSFGIQQH